MRNYLGGRFTVSFLYRTWMGILFLLYVGFSPAQSDSLYIQQLPNDRVIGIHSTLRDFSFSFQPKGTEKWVFRNHNVNLGLRLKYNKIGLSFGIPIVKLYNPTVGEPKAYMLGFNIFPSRFLFAGDIRYLLGMEGSPSFRPQDRLISGGLRGNFLFNKDRFSLRSALNMVNRQKKSAGSWLVSLPLDYHLYITDSLDISFDYGTTFSLNAFQSMSIGLRGGYAHSQVMRNWTFTMITTTGAIFRWFQYLNSETDEHIDRYIVNPQIYMMGSLVYNNPRFFIGIVGRYRPGRELKEHLNMNLQIRDVRLTIGRRWKARR